MATKTPLDSKYTIRESGCWEWNSPQSNGYGKVLHAGKRYCAHRFMYERIIGPIPNGKQLDHLCRNPRCVNPLHLEPVSPKENTRRGQVVKVNDDMVVAIRRARKQGFKLRELSSQFGVSEGHISEICRGKYWSDLQGPIASRDKRGLQHQQQKGN